ncbi:MAG: membrane protease YdiL (CAAX protease family) [Psychromonas sp.]|jgi:membrane protease YdiL (CAAX protease family)
MNKLADFSSIPKGEFSFEKIILTIVLLASAFIGFGQLPLLFALLAKSDGGLSEVSQESIVYFLGENQALLWMLFPFVLALLAMFIGIKYIHKAKILRFFTSRESFDWKRFFFSAGIVAFLMTGLLVYSLFTSDELLWNFTPDSFFFLLLISIFIIPLQTTCEELIFRSYIFKLLPFQSLPWLRVLICGILFGLLHWGNPELDELGKIAIVYYVWSGFFLGAIAHLDDGLELSMGYHAMNNVFAALIVTNSWQVFQTDALFIDMSQPNMAMELGVSMFLIQPIIFVFLYKKYGWKWRKAVI